MKQGLVVSDLHVGSIYGLLPPEFVTSDGREVSLNPGQQHLWKCWENMLGRVSGLTMDFVVVNGDVVDGGQRKSGGTELSLPLLADQAEAAIAVLGTLTQVTNCPVYFVQGTEYHDDRAGREAEVVAERFGRTVQYGGLGSGRYSHEVLDLEVEGVVLNFAHGISTGQGFYRATAIDREGIFSALAGKEGKMPRADVVVRSHCHFFLHLEHASKHLVISPCWQLQTRWMRKNSVYRMIPDIGVVVLAIDGEAKKRGDDPCSVTKILYDLPPLRATAL